MVSEEITVAGAVGVSSVGLTASLSIAYACVCSLTLLPDLIRVTIATSCPLEWGGFVLQVANHPRVPNVIQSVNRYEASPRQPHWSDWPVPAARSRGSVVEPRPGMEKRDHT